MSVLAIIAGVIFEGKRLSDKWSTVLLTTLGSFVFSFVTFIPGKLDHEYNWESHIEIWPYWFIFIFAISSIVLFNDKVVPKLTEGITLLQSLAVFYWVVDYGFVSTNNRFMELLMVIGLIFSFYSLFHAFTYTDLTRTSRLTLSIWSSVIMFLFASDNIYRVFQNDQIENATDITQGTYVALQFFLLGVSSIYMVQNFMMVIGFLPGKGSFFNDKYFRDLKDLKGEHIARYSDRQVSIFHSLFCVIFAGSIFALNYRYQILPRNVAIWIVFVIFPYILMAYSVSSGRRNFS